MRARRHQAHGDPVTVALDPHTHASARPGVAGTPPVRLERSAERIDTTAKTVRFHDGTVVPYDRLVSTMPINELLKRIVDCPAHLLEAPDDLRHTSGMVVGIGGANPCASTKCWLYSPGDDSPFYRVTYLSNYSPQMTPGPGHFSLLAEVSASPYKPESADDVVERTIEGLVASELLTPEQAATKIVSRELMRCATRTRSRPSAATPPSPSSSPGSWSATSTRGAGLGPGATRSATPTTQ